MPLQSVQIQKASDAFVGVGMDAMVYGPAGSGKSFFLATASRDPRWGKVLHVDVDGTGARSLQGFEMDRAKIAEWADLPKLVQELLQPGHGYGTILIDGLTAAQRLAREDIKAKNRLAVTDSITQQHWGQITFNMVDMVTRLQKMAEKQGVHVWFTALESLPEAPMPGARADETQRLIAPEMTRATSAEIRMLLSGVLHMTVPVGGKRRLEFRGEGPVYAKFRQPVGPRWLPLPNAWEGDENINMSKIMDLITPRKAA
jgi:hypothetical protein